MKKIFAGKSAGPVWNFHKLIKGDGEGNSICLARKSSFGHIIQNFMDFTSLLTWAATWQNQQNECAPSKDPVWSESLLCAQWVAKDPSFLHADSEDWSDWVDAQAD